jgi:hypothetical protein
MSSVFQVSFETRFSAAAAAAAALDLAAFSKV